STATPPSELYTLSLHDALPIWRGEHDDQQNDGKDPVHARNITVHDGKHTGTRLAATRSFSRSPIERSSHMGTSRNEGEGNKTADRNYREATRKFVQSERGQTEMKHAGDVEGEEEQEIRRAEEQAK